MSPWAFPHASMEPSTLCCGYRCACLFPHPGPQVTAGGTSGQASCLRVPKGGKDPDSWAALPETLTQWVKGGPMTFCSQQAVQVLQEN